MQPSEWMDILNSIEKKLPINQWKVNDIYLWPIIRIKLGLSLVGKNKLHNENNNLYLNIVNKYLSFGKRLMKDIWYSFANDIDNHKVANSNNDFVFLAQSIDRRIQVDGCWYNIYYSPLIDAIKKQGKKYLIIEHVNNGVYKIPCYEKSYFIEKDIKFYTASNKIESILNINQGSKVTFCLESYNNLLEYLSDCGYADCFFEEKHLKSLAKLVLILCVYFRKQLHKTRPKCAFVVCYYSEIEMAFILACKLENIPVIDIQHGVQGVGHFAYSKWSELPENGYQLLPDIFAVWSEIEKNNIDSWTIQNTGPRSFVLGNLYNDICLTKEKNVLQDEILNYMRKIRGEETFSKYDKHILFTLQPDICIPEYIFEIIRQKPEYCWWIRLHPGMISYKKKIYNHWNGRKNPNIFVEQVEDLSLPALLSFVDIHVTCYSSVGIEAAAFGVKSIFINQISLEYYKNLIEEGMAFYCDGLDEFKVLLDSKVMTKNMSEMKEYQNVQIVDRIVKLEKFASKQ